VALSWSFPGPPPSWSSPAPDPPDSVCTSTDTLEGQAGKDDLYSRGDNSFDTDNCGSEADVAIADAFDTVNADCEAVIP
jgi:hypothetical protein